VRAFTMMASGPENPAPLTAACRGQSTVLGFTWSRERQSSYSAPSKESTYCFLAQICV